MSSKMNWYNLQVISAEREQSTILPSPGWEQTIELIE